MAEVRLVRCPKCENLLPELHDLSPYKCGGCGTVLGVKKNGLSDVSDEVKGSRQSEEYNVAKASGIGLVGRNLGDMESVEGVGNEYGSSPKRTDDSLDYDKTKRGKERVRRIETFDEEYDPYSRGVVRNRNRGKNFDLNADRLDYVRESRASRESLRSSNRKDRWGVKSNFHDEGQSSYDYKRGERARYLDHGLDEVARIESLENGRAELLRKLDELKNQITRSSDVVDKPDPYSRRNDGYVQGPSNGVPQYINRPAGFVPYTERRPESYTQNGWGYQRDFLHRPDGNRAYHDYGPGYYGDVNPDLVMLHRHENFFHQPACSCVHCHDKNWSVPPNVDRPGLHNQKFQQGVSNLGFHQNQNHREGSILHPLHSQQPRNDMDSDNDGLDFGRLRRFGPTHRRGRVSYPVAGGAPFMTCDNCFELLKVPTKHFSLRKNRQKLKCGMCSSVILFEPGRKGFITSVSAHVDKLPPEIDEGSNDMDANSFSKNVDDLCDNFEKNSVSGGSERQLDPLSSTSSLYDEAETPRNTSAGKHGSEAAAESPVAEPDPSPEDETVKNEQQEIEKAPIDITNVEENPMEASGVATEISLNEFSNSYVSQGSADTNKDHSKGSKGSESFFAALIKKGFRDFTKPNRGAQVYVNGHLIPEHAVKKAERLAGRIQPGDYWYDKIAGFWGVMDHPCLGIIMPNIKEFDYPLVKNCAAGNTGVYVNGRELNQRDLDLLVKRGLPITEDKSYFVKITGDVFDEQTGEQLKSLGKLAPTVLRAKHGFGMKVLAKPKS